MIYESNDNDSDNNALEYQRRVDAIVARGPGGAFALAGIATAIVLLIWLIFYVMIFVARGGGN
jgi:hypothetical protein